MFYTSVVEVLFLAQKKQQGTPLFPLLVLFFIVVLPLWGIFDAAGRRESQWREAEQNKIVWVLADSCTHYRCHCVLLHG
jgi:hypothetical protein